MKGDYPRFRAAYSHEELAEQFLLTPTDLELISQCRGDINRHEPTVYTFVIKRKPEPAAVGKADADGCRATTRN
jgi:hypothetical protein